MLVHHHPQAEVDGHQMEWSSLLDQVLGAELTEVGVLVELAGVQVEEHVAQLVLDAVQGMHSTRVAGHSKEGVARRGAEPAGHVLDEVGSLIGGCFRDRLEKNDTPYTIHHIQSDTLYTIHYTYMIHCT